MLSLEEAIKHAEEVVEENEKLCKAMPEHSANAFHCAEEHRQLAEWLKELRAIKQTNTAEWEWVQYKSLPDFGNYHCSKCRHIEHKVDGFKYCPNCGSRMKGENQ